MDIAYGAMVTVPKREPKSEPYDEIIQAPLIAASYEEPPVEHLSPETQAPASEFSGILSSGTAETTLVTYQCDLTRHNGSVGPDYQPDFSGMSPSPIGIVVDRAEGSSLHGAVGCGIGVSEVMIQTSRKKFGKRSNNLVRACELSEYQQIYYRDIVRSTRMLFDALRIFSLTKNGQSRHASDEGKGKAPTCGRNQTRGDLLASEVMREHGLWLNRDKRIVGNVPGIEVGDVFFYRMELCVVGLHGQLQAGIDYLSGNQSSNGEPVATSIIVSGGYEDDEDLGDVLIYTGHGGQSKSSKQCMDQKLDGGNLALRRSEEYNVEIRVIRGLKYDGSPTGKVYVYDGLYQINQSWYELGKSGFRVFKYKLVRIKGQPEMGSTTLLYALSLKTRLLDDTVKGYLSLDVSNKKEKTPVLLFNDIDDFRDPLLFDYLPKTAFPPYVLYNDAQHGGCDCVSGCIDGCTCAVMNGGEFAYEKNGYLLRGKPVIFECGPACKCPPSCLNRVTQRGLAHRLEVFRSVVTGWGVRSLDLIQAGTFICEYTGVVLTMEQARIISMNGDNLIYPHRFAKNWLEWGNLTKVFPDLVCPLHPAVPTPNFAMDVSRMRNVASYFSHSTSPNVFVQLVLYDHNNMFFPHLMLFALENIPPLKDLCLDYGVIEEDVPDEDNRGRLELCN